MRLPLSLALVVSVTSIIFAQSNSLKPNDVIYIEDSDFGQALSGAIMKKKVPVLVTTARDKASFFLEESSKATKEGSGERVAKVLAFGAFAGSGKTYEASVRLTNTDGIVLFAHNSKKENIRSAAEHVANKLKDYLKNQH
jgi:hypothetical protein